jgi:hypothetical protein
MLPVHVWLSALEVLPKELFDLAWEMFLQYRRGVHACVLPNTAYFPQPASRQAGTLLRLQDDWLQYVAAEGLIRTGCRGGTPG